MTLRSVLLFKISHESIIHYSIPNAHSTLEEALNLDEFQFNLAFSVHNYFDPTEAYNDWSKVNWMVKFTHSDGISETVKYA